MGVNQIDEIFKERAQYLVNIDDMMFELYGEPIFDKRNGTQGISDIYKVG
jgi:hypothetical protein